MNIVILRGVLRRDPDRRTLPAGTRVLEYDLAVRAHDGPVEGVPVVWPDPPAHAHRHVTGTEVVVLGRVRRRFFRGAAGTQSRTEVVAEEVVPARQARRADALVDRAVERVE